MLEIYNKSRRNLEPSARSKFEENQAEEVVELVGVAKKEIGSVLVVRSIACRFGRYVVDAVKSKNVSWLSVVFCSFGRSKERMVSLACSLHKSKCSVLSFVRKKEWCPWLVVYTKEREKRCKHPLNCKERRKKEAGQGSEEKEQPEGGHKWRN